MASGNIEEMQFLEVPQVLDLLKTSRTNLYALMRRKINPIPSVKMGKSRRFPLVPLRLWMEKLSQ